MPQPRIPKPGEPDYDPDNPGGLVTGNTGAGNPKVPIWQDPNAPDGGGTDTGQNPDNPYPPSTPVVQHPELRNPPTTTQEGDPKTVADAAPSQYFPPAATETPYDPTPTGANVHDTGAADPNVDPFATIGGGSYINGGWVPHGHPAETAAMAADAAARANDPRAQAVPMPKPGATDGATDGASDQETMDSAMREAIMNLLHSKMPTNAELAETPEASAYRLASQRGHERDVAQLANSAAVANYSGTPEQEAKTRGLGEQRGEREAAFMGQLATQRLQMQRDDIQKGIAAAQSQGQFEAAQALQLQLAQMDDAIRRLQLAQTKTLTEEGYDVQRDLAEAQNNLQRYNIDTSRLTAKEQIDLNRELGLSELGFKYNSAFLNDKLARDLAGTGTGTGG